MRDWKGSQRPVAIALALALFTLGASREAAAQHRGGGGHGHVVVYGGGFYGGWAPWYGFGLGWGPYWGWGGFYPGYPGGGVDMNYAMMSGMGAVELNVKPNRADVWVDGRYIAEARDLDGYPTYLWLADGAHRLQVYKGGFKVFDDQIDVRRGMRSEIKLKLEPGESTPPGVKPGEKTLQPAEKPKDEKPKSDKPKDETEGSN
jgi:PEGA domain